MYTDVFRHRSLQKIRNFVNKLAELNVFIRFLRRDEIREQIANSHWSINDTVSTFAVCQMFSSGGSRSLTHMFQSVNGVQILNRILAAEHRRKADTAAILNSINRNPQRSQPAAIETAAPPRAPDVAPHGDISESLQVTDDPQHILAQLQAATARQNDRDAIRDAIDLRQLMRTMVHTDSDAGVLSILGIGRDEMPEACKTLQRLLEKEVERGCPEDEAAVFVPVTAANVPQVIQSNPDALEYSSMPAHTARSYTNSSVASSAATGRSRMPWDTLDREFIETGIDALRRLSDQELALPSWTITRYEVEQDECIGQGSVSEVYKGTWRNHVVAIKVLPLTTRRQHFVNEVSNFPFSCHPIPGSAAYP